MYKVWNENKEGPGKDFHAKFNGDEYFFPTGEGVYIGRDAAAHIFGLGTGPDRTAVLARHGWVTFSSTYAEGKAILDNFKFEAVEQQLDAPLALQVPPTDHGPAPVIQNAPARKGGTDGSTKRAGVVADAVETVKAE